MAPLHFQGTCSFNPFLGHLGCTSHLCCLRPLKRWFWIVFVAPQKWPCQRCHSHVGRGLDRLPLLYGRPRVSLWRPCVSGPQTSDTRVICESENPKIKVVCLTPSLPTMVLSALLLLDPVVNVGLARGIGLWHTVREFTYHSTTPWKVLARVFCFMADS